ncbi:MAG: cache domain-containing protein [Acidobacteria bacterium]|nr:cache domain-containing protein [Acidobacteriota bacterium]
MRPTMTDWKFNLDFRMLSILLLIAIIAFLLGTWWLVSGYRTSSIEAHGRRLAEEADVAFEYLENFLGNQIVEIAAVTETPVLRSAVEQSNRQLQSDVNGAIRRTSAVEARWKDLDYQSPELQAVLDNPAADFLRRYMKVRTAYREIIVTDLAGRTVAATGKTTTYGQSGDPWWKGAYADGQKGGVYIGDMHFDESAGVWCLDIAEPFTDSKGGVSGVIKVVLAADEIHSIVASVQAGFGGAAALLRLDGSVIASPGHSFDDRRPYPDMADIAKAREFGQRFVVTREKPRSVIGMNARSFMELSPNLRWVLAISSPVEAVVAPLTRLLRNVVILMLAIVLLAVLVTLVMSRSETRKVLPEDPHFENL